MTRQKQSRHPRIFLSHSHLDRHEATKLQAVLEANGAETYLDQDKIQAGDILPKRIHEGISWCEIFLLIWSSKAASSSWVDREWDMAYESRKKIVPYLLDSTSLPSALENLVYVEIHDQELGNARLLRAVFGKDFRPPDPTRLFPGPWRATMDAFGMVQSTYDLELRENGQVEGEGGASQSGTAGELARQLGMEHILTMRVRVHGNWSYDQNTQTLTLVISASGFGQQTTDTVRIQTTGREKGTIQGQDLAGRMWSLRRTT